MTRPDFDRLRNMARDDSRPPRDPERKRPAASPGPSRSSQRGGAPIRGRSGYGVESIRPHLRAQIEYQKLWRPTFPPEADEPEE
ncbi:hypothetical protein [Ramlibacter algicola]|uniref:Uncharacterized protein n=1 Tax=Ramlibacter algicola TaxID=2795217 RepID=A0A934URL3_9BURK|nr:hypothetical protein [Ramlibacter algicola]MBK0392813.1 hypothetical protein [Ramlibacter algicola]